MITTEKISVEAEIIRLFLERDENAITAFEAYDKGLCKRIAYGITENAETAEECVNDLYLMLWNTIPPEKPRSLQAYAVSIIRNLALNLVKKQTAQKRAAILVELDECLDAVPEQEPDEIGPMLDAFLAKQPKVNALIFMRRYYYSDTVSHIAALTGYDENKVSRILSKMKKELRKYLLKGGITV